MGQRRSELDGNDGQEKKKRRGNPLQTQKSVALNPSPHGPRIFAYRYETIGHAAIAGNLERVLSPLVRVDDISNPAPVR
jgi:hypothetical protein